MIKNKSFKKLAFALALNIFTAAAVADLSQINSSETLVARAKDPDSVRIEAAANNVLARTYEALNAPRGQKLIGPFIKTPNGNDIGYCFCRMPGVLLPPQEHIMLDDYACRDNFYIRNFLDQRKLFEVDDFLTLLEATTEILMQEPQLLELSGSNYLVISDLHGSVSAAAYWIAKAESLGLEPVFLGDYLDRGPDELDLLAYLMAQKVKRPEFIHLLRGNHESVGHGLLTGWGSDLEAYFGEKIFESVIKDGRFASIMQLPHQATTLKIFKLFAALPVAATLNGHTFCVHAGLPCRGSRLNESRDIPPDLTELKDIIDIPKDIFDLNSRKLLCSLLWSDSSTSGTNRLTDRPRLKFTSKDVITALEKLSKPESEIKLKHLIHGHSHKTLDEFKEFGAKPGTDPEAEAMPGLSLSIVSSPVVSKNENNICHAVIVREHEDLNELISAEETEIQLYH